MKTNFSALRVTWYKTIPHFTQSSN